MKKCARCNKLKSLDDFTNRTDRVNSKVSYCKECMRGYYARYTGQNTDQIRRCGKTSNSGIIVDGKKLCSICQQWKLVDYFRKTNRVKCGLHSLCKKCELWYGRVFNRVIKMQFLIAYGGKCICCGETKIDLLTVEHMRGRGHKLIEGNPAKQLFYKLKKLNWPEGYEIRCWGCNLSIRQGMPCPHTKEYSMYEEKLELFILNTSQLEIYNKLVNKLNKINGVI